MTDEALAWKRRCMSLHRALTLIAEKSVQDVRSELAGEVLLAIEKLARANLDAVDAEIASTKGSST